MVPVLSLVFMVITILITIGLPIAIFLYFRKKYGAPAIPMVVGAAAFILFALILESIVHQLVLRPDAAGDIALRQQPVLYMLYGGFMAGLFEETARFIAFHIMKKKYNNFSTALAYGIGHGGIESVILAGITMISSFVLAITINTGLIEASKSALSGAALEQLNTQIAALVTTSPYMFLVSAYERIGAISIHMALTVLVFYAVMRRDKWWLFPAAIVLHAIIDFPAALYQTGAISSIFVIEAGVGICAIALIAIAVLVHKRYKLPEAPPQPEPETEPETPEA